MQDDVNKLTLAEIEALRDNLLRPLLFEPINDPGFKRPVAKLRAIVAETFDFIDRLNRVIHSFGLIESAVKQHTIFDDHPQLFNNRALITISDPWNQDVLPGMFISESAKSALQQFRSYLATINIENSRLRGQGVVCRVQRDSLLISMKLSALEALLLVVYLTATTIRLTKGDHSCVWLIGRA